MVLCQGYGASIDIWGIGVYAYELANYYPPFAAADVKDKYRVKRVVENAEAHRIWKNPDINEELKNFIDSILRYEPEERLGANGFD
jgi:serine/threonine protein kinase